jgi:DNA repair exonuclease SbcCD nuclease subunit
MSPSIVALADVHIDNLRPECRTDDYLDTVCRKLEWVFSRYTDVIIAGDLFDQADVGAEVMNRVLRIWRDDVRVYAIPGQHDLTNHSLKLIEKSSFQVLVNAGLVTRLSPKTPTHIGNWDVYGAAWGEEWPRLNSKPTKVKQLLIAHKTTWMEPFAPGQVAGDAARLLMAFAEWDGIVVGDNHQTFCVQAGERVLVSPGSVMRKRIDQLDHTPCVFEISNKSIIPIPVYLPVEDCMTTITHDRKKERDTRVDVFVQKLGEQKEVGLSFKDNLKKFIATNEDRIRPRVREIITECTGG